MEASVRTVTRLIAVLAMFAATPAFSQAACPLPYAAFEAAVPHVDLERCPASVPQHNALCRVVINQGQLHLFVFAEDGDQCLISVRTLTQDDYRLSVR